MSNFTKFAFGLAAMMIAVPATAATSSPFQMMKEMKASLTVKNSGKEMRKAARKSASEIMRMSELARKMKPGTVKTYGREDEEWMPDDTYTYTYDVAGHVTVETATAIDGLVSKTMYEYYPDGMLKSKITTVSEDGANFENYSKSEYEYDPILTDVIIDRKEMLWIGGEWQQVGNNYKRIITRNEQGNITSSVIAVLFQGNYDPTQKLEMVYGPDGKATEISEQILSFNYDTDEYFWEQGTKMTDIVWDRTDGQIYDGEQIFFGNNRIASAHGEDEDDMVFDVTVNYTDDSDNFTATLDAMMGDMPVTAKLEYNTLENDGYIRSSETYYRHVTIFSAREEYRYDDWGLLTFSEESETEGLSTMSQSTTGEVEYDAEGKPMVYTVSESYYDDEIDFEATEYVLRAEYSDYVDVTSGSCMGVADTSSTERYFDVKGNPVETPEKGQIVVSETGSKKIF